jgi:hypothetical protein
VKNRVIIAAVILVGVFLVGFIPQYVKANRLDTELRQARQANVTAELRDLIGLAYVQANQKNYGLAAATTTVLQPGARRGEPDGRPECQEGLGESRHSRQSHGSISQRRCGRGRRSPGTLHENPTGHRRFRGIVGDARFA